MTDTCPFCEITMGGSPAHLVLEDEDTLGFLDRKPLFPGHCLVIPRAHHETLAELPAALLPPLFRSVQRLTRAIETALGAEGSFVAMNNRISQSVAHLHVHVVPRRHKDGLKGFFWPRQKYDSEEDMAKLAAQIRGAL